MKQLKVKVSTLREFNEIVSHFTKTRDEENLKKISMKLAQIYSEILECECVLKLSIKG